jgi:hypothetical protein
MIGPYFKAMEEGTCSAVDFKESQEGLWQEFKEYATSEWDIAKIGFTAVPSQLIFREKAILFKYAVVALQEMKKDKIDKAPGSEASDEVMRVYAEPGLAVNEPEKGIPLGMAIAPNPKTVNITR